MLVVRASKRVELIRYSKQYTEIQYFVLLFVINMLQIRKGSDTMILYISARFLMRIFTFGYDTLSKGLECFFHILKRNRFSITVPFQ